MEEEQQIVFTLEQMMECWNTALKFKPSGPGFIEFIKSLKLKENEKKLFTDQDLVEE